MTRIMIVEDEPLVAADVEEQVTALGYELAPTASTGEQALSHARAVPVDLVLMDVQLAGGRMDGIAAAAQLRAELGVPVVFLTAFADKQTLQRAVGVEPLGYLLKPFTNREVAQAIELALVKQRARAESAQRSAWLEAALRSVAEAVIVLDEHGRVVLMNSVAEALAGTSVDLAAGKPWQQVFPLFAQDDTDGSELVARALREGAAVSSSTSMLLRVPGREDVPVELSAIPTSRDQATGGGGAAMVMRDVREAQRVAMQLSMTERLTALGNFASGLAHEINNPLTAVMTGIDLTARDVEKLASELEGWSGRDRPSALHIVQRMRTALEAALSGTLRVAAIVKDLSLYSRPGKERRPLSMSLLLESALRLVENQLRHRARLICDLGPSPLVDANEAQLARAFVALLVNAADAIPEGHADENTIRVVARTGDDGSSIVEIHDTGRGMTPDLMVHMYEPFFTTKAVGAGMGLGLAIAHSVIVSHGGQLSARSEPGRGSTFTARLPPSREQVRTITTAPGKLVEPQRLRILIVDDEQVLGSLLAEAFRAKHEVTVTTSARKALEMLESGAQFDAVLCDVSMPELDGISFHERVSKEHPQLASRFVFMTGGAFTPRTERFLEAMAGRYVLKPVRSDVVERMLLAVASADEQRQPAELAS